MTTGTFGDHLKREREMRGVSLDEISAATRIATRFLRAIENEQWEQLPGGVFNRGFVRAVARYLGLDEENTVAEYAAAVGDRPTVPVWSGSPPAVVPDQPWLAWIATAVVAIVLLAGGWFGVRRVFAWRAARHEARIAAENSAAAADQAAIPPSPDSTPPSTDPSSNTAPAAPATPTGTDSQSAPASSFPPPAATPFELKVESGKTTHVTVDADGDRVFEGDVKSGEERSFVALNKFEVSARDAGALLLELNGKTLAPIGPRGQAGKVTLTRDSLKDAAGGTN
jgi:cytoskeleton protein RodZ